MRYSINKLVASCVALLLLGVSCHKKNDVTPPPAAPTDSFRLNLNRPASAISIGYGPVPPYELIISEDKGKVVLDTIVYYNVPVVTWLKTNEKLLDLTIVSKWATTNNWLVHSYKSIDLRTWDNIPDNDSIQAPTLPNPPPDVTGISTYNHVNLQSSSYFNYHALYSTATGYASYTNTLYAQFKAPLGSYAYLIFPELGLFDLHRITDVQDVTDLSNPLQAVSVPFKRGAYSTSSFVIAGYPDTSVYAITMGLGYYDRNGQAITDADYMYYPGKNGFGKYYFTWYGGNADQRDGATVNYPYVDTVPANFVIPDPSWFSVARSADTGFMISAAGPTTTYYEMVSTIGAMQFTLTAPSSITVMHPVSFYRALKSKYLGDINFGSMTFNRISFTMDTETDYAAYWTAHAKIYQAWMKPGTWNMSYWRRL